MTKEEAFEDVFRVLRQSGIRFCSLRDDLGSSASSGDLDLLVESERRDAALSCLASLGFRVVTRSLYIPYKVALSRFSSRMFQIIDLHFKVVQDGYVVLDGNEVLRNCVEVGDYYLPAHEHLFAILAVHNLVGKGAIQKKHIQSLEGASAALTPDRLRAALGSAPGLADALLPLIGNITSYARNSRLTRELRDSVLRVVRRNDPRSRIVRVRRNVARLTRRWRVRAPLYAFLGGDGVGKSSLVDALIEQLNAGGQIRAIPIYMGPWGHYLLPFVRGELFVPGWSISTRDWWRGMLARSESRSHSWSDVLNIAKKTLRNEQLSGEEQAQHEIIKAQSRLYLTARYVRSVASACRFLATVAAESCYRYYKAYKYRRRGILVVADRYIYDLMTGRMHEEIPNYARTRRFICKVFFRPTRAVLLVNDPEVILARKQDLTSEQLDRFTRVYEQMAEEYGFFRIKTNLPPQELAEKFIAESFDEIAYYLRK